MADPTHTLVKKPQMTLRDLADYMGSSAQARRTFIRDCKYRKIARLIQHKEAKAIATNWLVDGSMDPAKLHAKAAAMERRLFADDFDEKTTKYNADYVRRFADTYTGEFLHGFTIEGAKVMPAVIVNGVRITFDPAVFLTRVNKVNALKIGVMQLRYAKGTPLDPHVGEHQSAFMFAHLKNAPFVENGESEKAMCLTHDAYTGKAYAAPGNSVYLYNEMAANCATIADAWDNIAPPAGAVF